jgi:hypothetical protein|tara:strand:- start:1477 stop:2013 length:537 start_codon:yes stop_codon:yes gene_type:complete
MSFLVNPYMVAASSKALIDWNTPLNLATQDAGVLTASTKTNSWSNCCNVTSDAETYVLASSGNTPVTFYYDADVTNASRNVQIGLKNSPDLTSNNQLFIGIMLTDVVYSINNGVSTEMEASPLSTDTWSISINADRSGSYNKNDSSVATWAASDLPADTYYHQSTCYYQTTYCSATVE